MNPSDTFAAKHSRVISSFQIIVLLLCAASVRAANLAVTTTADSGTGSLRATIASANSGDTILFAGSLAGQTIYLTSGELSIGKNLTIDGSALPIGAKPVSISGGGTWRVLEITAGNVTVISLTLTNGIASGIVVDPAAALTLNGSTVCGCTGSGGGPGAGGGIYNYGSLQLSNSTISGCSVGSAEIGGGVYDNGTALFNNCTFVGNSAGYGAGVAIGSVELTLNNCTFISNSAVLYGGGVESANTGTLLFNNCTLTDNSAQYGGAISSSASTVRLTNTIAAYNLANTDIDGSYSGIYNFIGGNPELAPLGNYGGPTQTMPPMFGSPVIDAGSDSVLSFLTTDQRGYARLSGAHVDIGAVEAQFAPAINPPVLKNITLGSTGFQFGFTNAPNRDFTALTSTNVALPLANWTVLGNAIQISSGQYQFTDTSATSPAQFYCVVSP